MCNNVFLCTAIHPNVTAEEFKEILMTSIPSMGEIYTYKHGDCANFILSVAFLSNPGDLETIQVLCLSEQNLFGERERERERER